MNYIKVLDAEDAWRANATPEEVENADIQRELKRDLLAEYSKVCSSPLNFQRRAAHRSPVLG
jgi:hypothetical protein